MGERKPLNCYVFDIDGTLADLTHRLHFIQQQPKDWDGFFGAVADDAPIPHMVRLCRIVERAAPVVFMSGRPLRCHDATVKWLAQHGLVGSAIYMRSDGDHRPDDLVKAALLEHLIDDCYAPIMTFDDRDRVVAMWRERGIDMEEIAQYLGHKDVATTRRIYARFSPEFLRGAAESLELDDDDDGGD